MSVLFFPLVLVWVILGWESSPMQEKVENKRSLLSHKIRWRTQTLFFSLTLNAIFLAIFFYFFVKESPIPITFSYRSVSAVDTYYLKNVQVLETLEKIPFDSIPSFLKDTRHIEDGVTMRDLCLSYLVAKEQFDVERALGRKPLLKGTLAVEDKKFPLFDITDKDFKIIVHFASIEKFPYTMERLFFVIQEKGETIDSSFLQMFFESEDFLCVEKLFALFPLQKKVILTMLLEGTFEMLHGFTLAQKENFDNSDKKRREFLLKYLTEGSKTASLLLLHTDLNFAVKFLDDKMALTLLQRLPEKNEKGFMFAAALLNSPRSEILKRGAEIYISQDKELAKKFFNRPSIGQLRPVYRDTPPKAPAPSYHTIATGDSLWSLSRKYQVPIETLMQLNNLTTTNLTVGKLLKLPNP